MNKENEENFRQLKYIPLSKFSSTLYLIKRIINFKYKIFVRKLKKNILTNEKVVKGYEWHWGLVLDSQEWKKKDFQEFNFPKKNKRVSITTLIDNKICQIRYFDYTIYRPMRIYKILKEFTEKDDVIVELGFGWGWNLFNMIAFGLENKLEGCEITENGFNSCKIINQHYQCNLKLEKLDLTKNFGVDKFKEKTLFTHYAMEAMKYDTKKVLENILISKPKQVIHIEPIYELYNNNLRDITSKLYIEYSNYQDNLLKTLQELESEDKIEIKDIRRLGYGHKSEHEASMIRWIPK